MYILLAIPFAVIPQYIFAIDLPTSYQTFLDHFDPLIEDISSQISEASSGSAASLGSACSHNDECLGTGVICSKGTCRCHPSYAQDGSKCELAPDRVGQSCTTSCKPPLICHSRTNQCQCFGGTVRGGQCIRETGINQACSSDADCTAPFTECRSRRCTCLSGTTRRGTSCQPSGVCPDGSSPQGKCKLKTPLRDSKELFENTLNSGGELDTCGRGRYCVAYDDNSVDGFCCTAVCPFGGVPSGTCDGGSSSCPEETHHCVRTVGPTFATNICCPRPCLDPTPVMYNGKCYPASVYLADCELDAECDGGISMTCGGRRRKRCQCKDGYRVADVGPGTNLVCTKECPAGQISAGKECVAKAQAGWRCVTDWQCPKDSYCTYGRCRCGSGMEERGGRCYAVTKSSGSSSSSGNVRPIATNTNTNKPTSSNSLVDTISGILNNLGIKG